MKWTSIITEAYQETAEGTARAHSKYYIYKVGFGEWYAGRYAFGRDIDFNLRVHGWHAIILQHMTERR